MAQQHRCIYRDNYSRINDKDLIRCVYPDINDHNIDKFIINSNSFDEMIRNNKSKRLCDHLREKITSEIGLMFANAYTSKNYEAIEAYIQNNNVPTIDQWNINIIKNNTAMRYILLETIQDYLNVIKYVLRQELRDHFQRIFPYCLKKHLMQYIGDFFIPPK